MNKSESTFERFVRRGKNAFGIAASIGIGSSFGLGCDRHTGHAEQTQEATTAADTTTTECRERVGFVFEDCDGTFRVRCDRGQIKQPEDRLQECLDARDCTSGEIIMTLEGGGAGCSVSTTDRDGNPVDVDFRQEGQETHQGSSFATGGEKTDIVKP